MLYEVITVMDGCRCASGQFEGSGTCPLDLGLAARVITVAAEPARITSYNVCYTKLLREVRVVAPEIGDPGKMGAEVGWIHRLKASLPKAVYELLELAYSLHAYRKLKAAAADFRPDVIYERYNLFLLAGAMLKKRLGIPLLLEVNSPLVYERSRHSGGLALPSLAKWAESTAWRAADWVLPVTRVLAGYVTAYGVPEERIAVIPNGINKAHFDSAPTPDAAKANLGLQGRLVLGFTGFVRDWHGVDRVIDWMASGRNNFV